MRRITQLFSFQKLLLFLILGAVIYQSRLTGSQWLIGWDSVMPELNWKLNFSREVVGMWQEYQGVGLTGGMAHLADLSRMVVLWVVNFVVPTQYLRWTWHIGMLILGPTGIWYLGKKLWKWDESVCFVASIFYLLNMATVQYFFVPYEAFSSFYGFLPWLISTFLSYLESGRTRDLGRIILVGVLATSAFYVQTLFVVYVMVLGILSLGYMRKWGRILMGFLTIFLINLFWLLPIIYGVVNGGELVGLSKINSIGSPETSLMNGSFGNWQNVTLLKGYWLEYIEWAGGSKWGRLMQTWYLWSVLGWVMRVGLGIFGLSLAGLLLGMVKRQIKLVWIGGLLLAYMMVSSFNTPFGDIYQWLVDTIPLFGEMFRSVFTKWSVVLALFVSIGLGGFVASIKNKWITVIVTSLIVVSCLGIVGPVFSKGIFSEKMKVELPSEYLRMFNFMNFQPKSERVVYLPSPDMWSWKYTDWGYRGSGFLWYGIEQPILDRAFDVWSPYNETFYNQFSTALYGGEKVEVDRVLRQYDVKYILLDESVIAPGQDREILRIDETKKMASELGWTQKFRDGFLTVWDTGLSDDQFVSAPSSYSLVQGDTLKTRRDVIYKDVGTYVGRQGVAYPFIGLMKEEINNVEYGNGVTTLRSKLVGVNTKRFDLVVPRWKVGDIVRIDFRDGKPLPAYTVNGQNGPLFLGKEKPEDGQNYLVAKISDNKEWGEYLVDRSFELEGETLKIEVVGEPVTYDFATVQNVQVNNCDVLGRGSVSKVGNRYIADERGSVCDHIVMKEFDTRLPYLMRVKGDNILGRSVKFFLYNTWSKRNDIEYLLGKEKFDQTFSLLPWSTDGFYTLNTDVRSFGQRTENTLEPVEVRYLPLEQLAGAKVVPSGLITSTRSDLQIARVKKIGTWLYIVETKNSGLLRLSQGYDEGWVSPWIEHVRVDGWANGWLVPGSVTIAIFYWPQLLEYLGFGLLGIIIAILVFRRK